MSATYSGDPTGGRTDAVRFLLGDTGFMPGLGFILTDEEIEWVDALLLGPYDDAVMTAAFCADLIGNRFAGQVSISADGVSISVGDLTEKYRTLAANLRLTYRSLRGLGGVPLIGGIDAFDAVDLSVRPLNFGIGMGDNIEAGNQGLPLREYGGAEYESGP